MRMMLSTSVFAFAALLSGVLAEQLCNGYAEFCSRSYGNVTFIGAHDSAFVSATESVASNQHYDVTQQLNDGIRMLQSQGHHPVNGTTVQGNVELCHTNCEIFDGGTLVAYLQKVKAWLDQNPDEVLTILFTNNDGINVTTWAADFETAGIADLAYVPSFTTTPADTLNWPTLGTMISSGKRVVIFMDSYTDPTEVNYILPEFTYMWETAFDQTDPSFPCTVNRPASIGQVPTGRLATVNHFLDTQLSAGILIPDTGALNTTNGVSGPGSLGQQADECAALYGRYPNFLLVDYYDVHNGSVFKVAAELNGVPYIPSASVIKNTMESNATAAASVPSSAAAKKVLPIFIIMQLALSGLTIAGAFWLAWDDDLSKYERQTDRYATLIPAPFKKGHRQHDSVASVGSEAGFATELERGRNGRGHFRGDSTADLTAQAALMGTSTPRRLSMESSHSLDDPVDAASLRRVLEGPQPSRGFLDNRRNSLFLD